MENFKKFLTEDGGLGVNDLVARGQNDVDLASVRDNINGRLTAVTNPDFITPYIALERVARMLQYFHIYLPPRPFMEGENGVVVFEVSQFGLKSGMTDKGDVVTKDPSPYSIYFEYGMKTNGLYSVFCEIVDAEELSDLMKAVDDEMDNDASGELDYSKVNRGDYV